MNDNPWIDSVPTIQGNASWTQNEDFGTFEFHLYDYENDNEIDESGSKFF